MQAMEREIFVAPWKDDAFITKGFRRWKNALYIEKNNLEHSGKTARVTVINQLERDKLLLRLKVTEKIQKSRRSLPRINRKRTEKYY